MVMVHGGAHYYFAWPFADVGGIGRCEAKRAFFQRAVYFGNSDDYRHERHVVVSGFEFAASAQASTVPAGA